MGFTGNYSFPPRSVPPSCSILRWHSTVSLETAGGKSDRHRQIPTKSSPWSSVTWPCSTSLPGLPFSPHLILQFFPFLLRRRVCSLPMMDPALSSASWSHLTTPGTFTGTWSCWRTWLTCLTSSAPRATWHCTSPTKSSIKYLPSISNESLPVCGRRLALCVP